MWIKTQDQRKLVDVIEVQVQPRRRGVWIIGKYQMSPFINKVRLGKYDNMEQAQIILYDIQAHLSEKKSSVYEMK